MATDKGGPAFGAGNESVQHLGPVKSGFGVENHGIRDVNNVFWNLTASSLCEEAVRRREGVLAEGGALVVLTGVHTGRAPKDKFIVDEAEHHDNIWWGAVNRSTSAANFDGLHERLLAYYEGRDMFVQDCYAGADAKFRLPVRIITETAWHSLFAANMFIRPKDEELETFEPEFTIIQAPGCHAEPEKDGTNSEVFIEVSFNQKLVLIGGSSYAGEIKKSVFSILNYLLPARGVLPMHCSANIGEKGDTAIFFGLSGTGKTTLSADGTRALIGDDEHGWGDDGVFNFEGGCYAKVIRLSAEAEPEIYATTRRFGTILENVIIDEATRVIDFDDGSLTENTRASYPIDFIPFISEEGIGGHPENILMLTADAFGVLPPISRLSAEQAMYHFLSGYTAVVAGTVKGIKETQAIFSTCFGAPFMPRHPTVYGKLLSEKIAKHGTDCWLVNTGWTGGAYGVGKRMEIAHTRNLVRAALDGRLAGVATTPDPNFGVGVPVTCPDVPAEVLNPRNTWADKEAYDATARRLAGMFEENFKQFETAVDEKVNQVAIRPAA